MNKSTITKIITVLVVLALIVAALLIFGRPHGEEAPKVQIDTTDQPTRGKADAKVQIVVFEDLKCIACKRFNNTVLPEIKKAYIDTGVANYTVISLAFIPGSMPAANAARCLYKQNPEWFFTFVDNVYQNQPPENQDWATIPKLVEFAKVIPNLDEEKLSRCIYDSPYTDFMQQNFQQALKLQGSSVETPAIYINGRLIQAVTVANLRKAIDAAK
jgi:protein-disulfide isomerase